MALSPASGVLRPVSCVQGMLAHAENAEDGNLGLALG